ncbi:unnamed protein product, partial [Cylicostephanus goldi]
MFPVLFSVRESPHFIWGLFHATESFSTANIGSSLTFIGSFFDKAKRYLQMAQQNAAVSKDKSGNIVLKILAKPGAKVSAVT